MTFPFTLLLHCDGYSHRGVGDDSFNLNPDMTLFICHHAWIGYGIRVRQYLWGYVTVAGVTPHTYMINHVCVCILHWADSLIPRARPAPPPSLPCFRNEFMHREGLFALLFMKLLHFIFTSHINDVFFLCLWMVCVHFWMDFTWTRLCLALLLSNDIWAWTWDGFWDGMGLG